MTASAKLLAALSQVTGTGDFHSSGRAPFFLPKLHVKGLGELGFPIAPFQAEELIGLAEAAPYGQREKTVLDESVRKCWQVDAAEFSFNSPQWGKFLKKTVGRIGEDLGIKGKVSASPYKLLIYGEGGHFMPHRDTEKLDAMFGTLIIALPSAHCDGQLFIRHGGREIEIDFSLETHLHEFQFAAFFADCEHEVVPVKSGYRCCLVYNLRLDEGDPGQLNLSLSKHAKSLLPALSGMKGGLTGDLGAILLEHSYTEANVSVRNLKGNDVARAQALFAAAKEAGYIAHLALVTYHQMGELEVDHHSYGRRHRYDDDDDESEGGTMGEVYEEELTIDLWRDSADKRIDLGCYQIDSGALISKEEIDTPEPDEKEAEGFTGNAGCTMDYWYRRAAVVLWKEEDHERILCRYNFRGACAAFAELSKRKKAAASSAFQRLGEAIVAMFPEALPSPDYRSRYGDPSSSPFAITLRALADADAKDLLGDLLARVPSSAFVQCDATLWATLHKTFGVETFTPVYDSLLETDPEENRLTCFQVLDGLLKGKGGLAAARTIATRLAHLAPQPPRQSYVRNQQDLEPPGNKDEIRILLSASHLLEKPIDRRAALAFILADTSLAYTRAMLGPVLLEKTVKKLLTREGSLAQDTFAFARCLLEAEVARPIDPYPDWVRPCPQMKEPEPATGRFYRGGGKRSREAFVELTTFMADPKEKTTE